MLGTDDDTRWLVWTLFLGVVGGSTAAIGGLACVQAVLPWSLGVRDVEAGAFCGGVLGGGITVVLMAAACSIRRDRPYPPALALFCPAVGSAAVGLLVYTFNLA